MKKKKKIGFFFFFSFSCHHPFSNTIKSISFSIRFNSLSLTHTHNLTHSTLAPAVVDQIFPFSLIRSFSVLHFRVHVFFPLLFSSFCKTKNNFFSFVTFRLSPIYSDIRQSATVNMRNAGMKEYMCFEECLMNFGLVLFTRFS